MHGYIETTKAAKLLFTTVLREDPMVLDFWEELLKSVYLGKIKKKIILSPYKHCK